VWGCRPSLPLVRGPGVISSQNARKSKNKYTNKVRPSSHVATRVVLVMSMDRCRLTTRLHVTVCVGHWVDTSCLSSYCSTSVNVGAVCDSFPARQQIKLLLFRCSSAASTTLAFSPRRDGNLRRP